MPSAYTMHIASQMEYVQSIEYVRYVQVHIQRFDEENHVQRLYDKVFLLLMDC